MEDTSNIITEIGSRKLQQSDTTHVLNIPAVAVRALGWQTHDDLSVAIVNNRYITIEKMIK